MRSRFINAFLNQNDASKAVSEQLLYWYAKPLGKRLQVIEKELLDTVLADLFGYHLLQIARLGCQDLFSTSRVSHCAIMESTKANTEEMGFEAHLLGVPEGLPIASTSLDVVVLPHVLEFSTHPHEVLREVERTLIPEGHVVLLMFNPWSLWLLNRLLLGWRGRVPWCGRFFSMTRMKDWLALLGFDIISANRYFFRPPVQHDSLLDRLQFLESVGRRLWPVIGGGYLLVARKRVATLTPIRPRWQTRRRLVSSGLVEP